MKLDLAIPVTDETLPALTWVSDLLRQRDILVVPLGGRSIERKVIPTLKACKDGRFPCSRVVLTCSPRRLPDLLGHAQATRMGTHTVWIDFEKSTVGEGLIGWPFETVVETADVYRHDCEQERWLCGLVPTASPVVRPDLQGLRWDYSQFGERFSHTVAMTQGLVDSVCVYDKRTGRVTRMQPARIDHLTEGQFRKVMERSAFREAAKRLVKRWQQRGLNTEKLGVMVAIGGTGNALTPAKAAIAAEYAAAEGVGFTFVFNGGQEPEPLVEFLQAVRRPRA